jgi:hypothetical protein
VNYKYLLYIHATFLKFDMINLFTSRTKSFYLFAIALLVTSNVFSQNLGPPLTKEAQANLLTKIWLDSCAKLFGKPDAIRELAKAKNFQENPSYSEQLLAGEKGTVWDVSLGPNNMFALLLTESGNSCKVYARSASSLVVNETFEKVLLGVKNPELKVTKAVDKFVEKDGVKLRQLGYILSKATEFTGQGWAFVSTTSESESPTVMQATISISKIRMP